MNRVRTFRIRFATKSGSISGEIKIRCSLETLKEILGMEFVRLFVQEFKCKIKIEEEEL